MISSNRSYYPNSYLGGWPRAGPGLVDSPGDSPLLQDARWLVWCRWLVWWFLLFRSFRACICSLIVVVWPGFLFVVVTSLKVIVVVILVWRLVRRFLVRLRSWWAFFCGCLLQGFLRRLVPLAP